MEYYAYHTAAHPAYSPSPPPVGVGVALVSLDGTGSYVVSKTGRSGVPSPNVGEENESNDWSLADRVSIIAPDNAAFTSLACGSSYNDANLVRPASSMALSRVMSDSVAVMVSVIPLISQF